MSNEEIEIAKKAWNFIENVEKAKNLVEEREREKLGSRFRSYIRRFAGSLVSEGLLGSLLFAYSRAGDEVIKRLHKCLEESGSEGEVRPDKPDKVAWALVYYGAVSWLKESMGLNLKLEDPLSAFKALTDERERELISLITARLASYIGWIKRFAEGRYLE